MSNIQITSSELLVLVFDDSNSEPTELRADDVEISIVASIDALGEQPDYPVLRFCVEKNDGRIGGIRAIFAIDSYEDIDLLRRYCEMTLELFQSGNLN